MYYSSISLLQLLSSTYIISLNPFFNCCSCTVNSASLNSKTFCYLRTFTNTSYFSFRPAKTAALMSTKRMDCLAFPVKLLQKSVYRHRHITPVIWIRWCQVRTKTFFNFILLPLFKNIQYLLYLYFHVLKVYVKPAILR